MRRLALPLAVLVLVPGIVLLVLMLAGAYEFPSFGAGDAPEKPPPVVTLLAVGDIADCNSDGDEATAQLVAARPNARLALLGDIVYEEGTALEFERCFDPTWGTFRPRTRPAVGNHEYGTEGALPYYTYFGEAAGRPAEGYYSYELGTWHVVVLNSECSEAGGCSAGDPQLEWLRRDLAQHPTRCTLAYWHRPPFSSGPHGTPRETRLTRAFWQALYDAGADVVLAGHDHSYERFAVMDAFGQPDELRGMRLFVVGTGGRELRQITDAPAPASEVRNDNTWGVLELRLGASGYSWQFLPVAGGTFTDAGETACSDASPLPRDATTPAAPTNVRATVAETGVELSWISSPDAVYHAIERDDDTHDWVTGTTYVDLETVAGSNHRYRIRALDNAGNLSEFSEAVVATAPAG